MKYTHQSGKTNGLTIVLILVVVAIAGVFIVPSIINGGETSKLKAEINRIAEESNIQPASVECSNVELSNICYATYSLNVSSVRAALIDSGYKVENSNKDKISASNPSTSIRVDSEPNSEKGVVTLKFKDINVTL